MTNTSIKIQVTALTILVLMILAGSSTGFATNTTNGLKNGQEIIYQVPVFTMQINRTGGSSTTTSTYSVAGVDTIQAGKDSKFTVEVVSTNASQGLQYKLKYNTSESQTFTANTTGIEQVPSFLQSYYKTFQNDTDLTNFFPYVIQTTGINDSLWNTLNGQVFTNITPDSSGTYKNFLNVDIIKQNYNLQGQTSYSWHYYFTYDMSTGLLDHLHMNLEESWMDGNTPVSASVQLDIQQYHPRPNNTIPLQVISVVGTILLTVLASVVVFIVGRIRRKL